MPYDYECPPCESPLEELCSAWASLGGRCPTPAELGGASDDPILTGDTTDPLFVCSTAGCVTSCGDGYEGATYYFDASGSLVGAEYWFDYWAFCGGKRPRHCYGVCEDVC